MFAEKVHPALNIAVADLYECNKSTCATSRLFAVSSLRATTKDNEGVRDVSIISVSRHKTHTTVCYSTTRQLTILRRGHPRLLSQSGLPSHSGCLPYVPLPKQFLLSGNMLESLHTTTRLTEQEQWNHVDSSSHESLFS